MITTDERKTYLEEKSIRLIDRGLHCRDRIFRNYAFLIVIH